MENPDPGVNPAPPADPAAPAAALVTPPTGSETVINSGKEAEQTVPFSRFQEVNDKAKAESERAAQLESELEAERQKPQTPQNEDDVDPDVVDMVSRSAKKLGFVTQEELAARESQIQVRQDISALELTPPVPGIPYDSKAVMDYAKTNNLPITSKNALVAAYKEMNWDKIVEAERNKAIEGYRAAGSTGAEKPGPQGAQPPGEQEVTGQSPRERTRSRIAAARQKQL